MEGYVWIVKTRQQVGVLWWTFDAVNEDTVVITIG